MATYKSFTLNEPGDPTPWGSTELQAWKDLIDTVVEDCVEETKYTTGHRHFKLYAQTAGTVALTVIADGTGKFTSGEFKIINADAAFSIETYSTTLATSSDLNLKHSHHATTESMGATGDGEVLGNINFVGVNNALAWDIAASIISTQVGASAAQIGADLTFSTAYSGGSLSEKMKIQAAQNAIVGIGKSTLQSCYSGYSSVQLGGTGLLYSVTTEGVNGFIGIAQNVYTDESDTRRIVADEVSIYLQQGGEHLFYSNESAAADSTFSQTLRAKISSSDFSTSSVHLLIGKASVETWNTGWDVLHLGALASISTDAQTEAASKTLLIANNYYYDGAHKRIFNDQVTIFSQCDGVFKWYSMAAGAADTGFSLIERMRLQSYDYAKSGAQLGLGTDAPLHNVCNASGDFTGDGIHIKSDITNERTALLILEGYGEMATDSGTNRPSARLIFADNDSDLSADSHMVEIERQGETLCFNRVDDDGSVDVDDRGFLKIDFNAGLLYGRIRTVTNATGYLPVYWHPTTREFVAANLS